MSFLLGLMAVDRLTTKLAGTDVAARAVWLIAVFPFSFFLTAVYADALYFCLCAWSLTFAYQRRWPLACALAAMASMTRIPGLALSGAGLEYLSQNPPSQRLRRDRLVAMDQESVCAHRDPRDRSARHGGLLLLALRRPNRVSFMRAAWMNRRRGIYAAGRATLANFFRKPPIFACTGLPTASGIRSDTRVIGAWYLLLLP